jgi:hypothetical protein
MYRITKSSAVSEGLGLLKRKEEGKEQEVGISVVLIPRESGGRPVPALCSIQAPWFPNTVQPCRLINY